MVDESGYWRMDPKVPLVIPEVNPDDAFKHEGVIASPNCSTTQMVVAMKPLYDASRIRRVVVSTYQATSGAGVGGQRDLINGSKAALEGKEHKYETFAHPIAFNLIPQIGSAKYKGYTSRRNEDGVRDAQDPGRRPDQSLPDLRSRARFELPQRKHPRRDRAQDLGRRSPRAVREFPGHQSHRRPANGKYPKPSDCDGDDAVFIGRIREDLSCDNGLAFWCVSDNLRKGAATNAVQIAELLVKSQAAVSR